MLMTMDETPPFDEEAAWEAVTARDRAADGCFVMGVLSTGIYCRPSCPARRPARGNVRFFDNAEAARAAGLRACLRCRPDAAARDGAARDEAAVAMAVAAIRGAEGRAPGLAELAARAGYSPSHFQRVFSRLAGISPAAFARALRRERAAQALSGGGRVTDAIYEAGYGAPSRFYADSGRLGMAPSAWRDGGRGETIRWTVAETTLGPLLVAATGKGVCRVAFGEDEADLARRFPHASLVRGGDELDRLAGAVVAAVEQPAKAVEKIPLDVRGTAFQEAVWRELRRIPPGETRTYAQLAAAAGHPRAVRAAGTANGANPVAVIVPCHRVVRSNGTPGGYAWGAARKQELLRRERNGQS